MDVEEMIAGLEDLDRAELTHLQEALVRRLLTLGGTPEGGATSVSGVLEYRPHADSTLQAEVRRYRRKDGSVKERGPTGTSATTRAASRRRSTWAIPTIR